MSGASLEGVPEPQGSFHLQEALDFAMNQASPSEACCLSFPPSPADSHAASSPFHSEWHLPVLVMGLLSGSAIKNLLAIQEHHEIWVQSLNREDPLEEGTAAHSSILTWRILWTEEHGLQSKELQRVGHN